VLAVTDPPRCARSGAIDVGLLFVIFFAFSFAITFQPDQILFVFDRYVFFYSHDIGIVVVTNFCDSII
jgi:hypothetical protein